MPSRLVISSPKHQSLSVAQSASQPLLCCSVGWHWITWVWRYQGAASTTEDVNSDDVGAVGPVGPEASSGVKMLNVSMSNVKGAWLEKGG